MRQGEVYGQPTCFLAEGEAIEFSLWERLLRSEHVPTAADKGWGSFAPKWDFRPSGELRFRLVTGKRYGRGDEWQDSARRSLE